MVSCSGSWYALPISILILSAVLRYNQKLVLLLHEGDDCVIHRVAAIWNAGSRDDASKGDDRHLRGAAANVNNHVAVRFLDGKARQSRGKGFLHQAPHGRRRRSRSP